MDYFYKDCNIPCFKYSDITQKIKKYGNRELKTEKEIQDLQQKYSKMEDKAYVMGFISKELAKEITTVEYPFYVISLFYDYFFCFPDGFVVAR